MQGGCSLLLDILSEAGRKIWLRFLSITCLSWVVPPPFTIQISFSFLIGEKDHNAWFIEFVGVDSSIAWCCFGVCCFFVEVRLHLSCYQGDYCTNAIGHSRVRRFRILIDGTLVCMFLFLVSEPFILRLKFTIGRCIAISLPVWDQCTRGVGDTQIFHF